MNETYISFYLRDGRIRVFVKALRGLGSPSRICFMIDDEGKTLLILPHDKRDFLSHSVPSKVYLGASGMEVNSKKLCQIIAEQHHWDTSKSYRVPGRIYLDRKVAIYRLTEAMIINH